MGFLDDATIWRHADLRAFIPHLCAALAQGPASPSRHHYDLPGGVGGKFLVMPAWSDAMIGVKLIAVSEQNRARGKPTVNGAYVLLDAQTADFRAIFSAAALTEFRTAALSGVAASLMARPDSKTLLMVGAGALAAHMVRAHATMLPLERVLVWARDPDKARRIVERLSDLPLTVDVATNLAAATSWADVICTATSAHEPLIKGALVKSGAHVCLVGSFSPEMMEADSSLFERGRLVVDSDSALTESGDLIGPVAEGRVRTPVLTLADAVRVGRKPRRSQTEVTVFKAVGFGAADLIAAEWLLNRLRDPSDSTKQTLSCTS